MVELIGEVEGRSCVVVDDVVISGSTLVEVAETLMERGATRVVAAVTHGVFSGDAGERLERSPIDRLYVTDTIENAPSLCHRRRKSSASRRSSRRRSSASIGGRAAACCSVTDAMKEWGLHSRGQGRH